MEKQESAPEQAENGYYRHGRFESNDNDPETGMRSLYWGLVVSFFEELAAIRGQEFDMGEFIRKYDFICSDITAPQIKLDAATPVFVPGLNFPNVSGPGYIQAEYFPDLDKYGIFLNAESGEKYYLGEYFIFNCAVVLIDIMEKMENPPHKYFMPFEYELPGTYRETGFTYGQLAWAENGATGKDGKQYPRDRKENKLRIITAILQNPGANDYTIAKLTGASPHTVKRYRPEAAGYHLINHEEAK